MRTPSSSCSGVARANDATDHGVGLHFCRHLAIAMGGNLEARNEDGVTLHATVALAAAPEWEVEIAASFLERHAVLPDLHG
jgi:hypothetical protein